MSGAYPKWPKWQTYTLEQNLHQNPQLATMWTLACFWFVKGKVSQRNCKNNKISSVYLRIVCFFLGCLDLDACFFHESRTFFVKRQGYRHKSNDILQGISKSLPILPLKKLTCSFCQGCDYFCRALQRVDINGERVMWLGGELPDFWYLWYGGVALWGIRDPSVRFLGYHLRKGDSQDSENFQTSDLTKAPNYPSPNWR